MNFTQLAQVHGTDKFEHGYMPYYERHLKGIRQDLILLEIGIAKGASLRMWADAFPHGTIIGIDNNPDVLDIDDHKFGIIFGDATNKDFINSIPSEVLPPYLDVIIDDGSHNSEDIIKSFEMLFPRLAKGGWYVIEDLGAQFHDRWGGSEKGSESTQMIYRRLLDTFRGWDIKEFHAYEEIVFIRKEI